MSGRTEQLGRQLRRLRINAADQDDQGCAQAVRRATHLARDLALEATGNEEAAPALADLASRGIIDLTLAEHIARWIQRFGEPGTAEMAVLMDAGRDLDRFLRSIEHGTVMPELPFVPYQASPGIAATATSKSAATVSGRHVVIAERGGEGLVFVDDRPVGKPFPLLRAPTSKPEVIHEASGVTRLVWESEGLAIQLGADFASIIAGAHG